MEVTDKVAVVTGGGSGIGRGICQALAERGAHVVVADVDGGSAERVAGEIAPKGVRSAAVACDVASFEAMERLAAAACAELGRVDLLFNNAGVVGGGPLLATRTEDLRWLFDVNVTGVWNGCVVFGRRFVEQGTPAHICNTGSEHSLGRPHLGAGLYTATKHAVLGLSDVLRAELPSHIGVSVLCPGVVNTEFWNAERNRPQALGGPPERPSPGAQVAKTLMTRGKSALEIGRRAVEGVIRGDFLIVTHATSRSYAEERHQEVSAAFDAQAPMNEEERRYDTRSLVEELVGRGRP